MITATSQTAKEKSWFRRLYDEEFMMEATSYLHTYKSPDIAINRTALEERKLDALKISELTKQAVYRISHLGRENGARNRSDDSG